MSLSLQEVEYIAELAKLHLTEEEKVRFGAQLSNILEHMQILQQLDTAAIPPTASVLPLRTVLRDDIARPPMPRDEALANAPERTHDSFVVEAVLD